VARSGDGEVTECPGPQNEAGRSVFECLPEGGETIGEATRLDGAGLTAAGFGPDGGWLLLFGWVVLALLTPIATARRRLLR
jgi:hypothetical protein